MIEKHVNKLKRIDHNSGNFFSLKTSFRSDDLLLDFGYDRASKKKWITYP